MKHKVLDLFSGIGGFSLGLEWAGGFETVAFCENDKECKKVLGKHWPNVKIYEDIQELTNEQLQADGILPTIITGGFPCQDISTAGKGVGIIGKRSGLWKEMFRLIKDVRPKWAIAENVSALRSRGLAMVLQDLSEIGYRVEWHCIPANAINGRHRRDRIWIIAHLGAWPESEGNDKEKRIGGDAKAAPMADSMREGSCGDKWEDKEIGPGGDGPARRRNNMAYPYRQRVQEYWSQYKLREISRQEQAIWRSRGELPLRGALESVRSGGWWDVEPPVGRVANGLPRRVHRLKQLGNSVVPQIPMVIGMMINATQESSPE